MNFWRGEHRYKEKILAVSVITFSLFGFLVRAVFATPIYGPGNIVLDPTCTTSNANCTVGLLEVFDETVSLTNDTSSFNFAGSGVTATQSGGAVTVTVPGMAVGGSVTSGTLGSVYFAGTSGALAQDNSNFFWNDTTNRLGLGTNTPTTVLDLVGNSQFTMAIAALDNDGSIPANEFITTVTAAGTITDSSYKGISSSVEYTSNNDISDITPTAEAALMGMYSIATNSGDGDVSIAGGDFRAVQDGSGTSPDVRGLNLIAGALAGGITDLKGFNSSVFNRGSGIVAEADGINANVTNQGSGSITNGYGINAGVTNNSSNPLSVMDGGYGGTLSIDATAGTITNAIGLNLKVFMRDGGTGVITNATGLQFTAAEVGSFTEPGLEATGQVIGIGFQTYTGVSALEGTDVYGIYFTDSNTLDASGSNEYALYIGDTDAENWFSNGLMIGDDTGGAPSLNSKIDDDNSGSSSTQLYIGTNTIDTTAPSDERTKRDIVSTTYGLEELNQINIVDFTYDQLIINDDNKRHSGVLAQQVAPIYPEAVSERSDNYFMVDYKTFVPLIMKSIQELDLKIVGIQNMTDDTFLGNLRTWLASATNGITSIFTQRVQTDELCVGTRCITEAQFIQLLDANNVSGGGNTHPPENNPPADGDGVPPDDGGDALPPPEDISPPDEIPPPIE